MEPDVHFGHEILELTRDVSRQVRFDPFNTFWRTADPCSRKTGWKAGNACS